MKSFLILYKLDSFDTYTWTSFVWKIVFLGTLIRLVPSLKGLIEF